MQNVWFGVVQVGCAGIVEAGVGDVDWAGEGFLSCPGRAEGIVGRWSVLMSVARSSKMIFWDEGLSTG